MAGETIAATKWGFLIKATSIKHVIVDAANGKSDCGSHRCAIIGTVARVQGEGRAGMRLISLDVTPDKDVGSVVCARLAAVRGTLMRRCHEPIPVLGRVVRGLF
ncbi:MAG: hypothetical protein H7240_05900 [Glaciimonas sp.]|nr:hypothetical protein [Glaciimonas sp.]